MSAKSPPPAGGGSGPKRGPADPRSARAAAATQREAVRRRAAQAREKLEALRADLRRRRPPRKPRRWRRWLLLVLVLLLLLLLLLRSCGEEPVAAPAPEPTASGAGVPAPPAPPPEPPPTGQVQRRDRPAYEVEPPEPLPWIDAFRMQVAARSPRLAACFVGADAPGRLKWTASVEPASGEVSDHALEPSATSAVLTQAQRACVIGVLSDPPYRLKADAERSTPSRVGMVIEF